MASPSLTLPYDDDLHRHSYTNVHSSSLWPHLFRPSQSSTIFHRYPAIGSKSLSSMNKSFHFYRQALRLHISRFVRRLPEARFFPCHFRDKLLNPRYHRPPRVSLATLCVYDHCSLFTLPWSCFIRAKSADSFWWDRPPFRVHYFAYFSICPGLGRSIF